jgi:hypothetical protein
VEEATAGEAGSREAEVVVVVAEGIQSTSRHCSHLRSRS